MSEEEYSEEEYASSEGEGARASETREGWTRDGRARGGRDETIGRFRVARVLDRATGARGEAGRDGGLGRG